MQTDHTIERLGDWFPTFSGKKIWLLSPHADDIDIKDIAHSLSLINRFNGHTKYKRGYSVGQHAVLGSRLIRSDYAMEFLMHDAAEAYVGDLIRPLKEIIGQTYHDIENKISLAVQKKFNLLSFGTDEPEVKDVDNRMAATEIRDLCNYRTYRHMKEEPYPFKIKPWKPEKAEREFLARYAELANR